MRLMTAIGVCEEKGEYTYQSNKMTEVLAVPGQIAGMRYMTETLFPIGSKIREYMNEAEAKNGLPQSLPACKFAFGKTFWQLLDDEAGRRASFNEYMKAARRGGQVQLWHERYPPAAKLKDEKLRDDSDALLMVDVGGGVGGQVGAFRQQYADLPGRCVLQDLPDTIKNNASPPANVELMAYDFFTPQPLKGKDQISLTRNEPTSLTKETPQAPACISSAASATTGMTSTAGDSLATPSPQWIRPTRDS